MDSAPRRAAPAARLITLITAYWKVVSARLRDGRARPPPARRDRSSSPFDRLQLPIFTLVENLEQVLENKRIFANYQCLLEVFDVPRTTWKSSPISLSITSCICVDHPENE